MDTKQQETLDQIGKLQETLACLKRRVSQGDKYIASHYAATARKQSEVLAEVVGEYLK